jgi:hypothetical protein
VTVTWGFSTHLFSAAYDSPANYAARLVSAGGVFWRDDFSASVTTTNPSTASMDAFGNLASPNNKKLVLILMNGLGAIPDLSTLRTYSANLASYFDANFPGVLHAIEPVNEPNGSGKAYGPNGGAAYAPVCTAVYDGVHSVTSAIKVWGGATDGGGIPFTQQAHQAGVKYDEWSCHAYPFYGRALGSPTRTAAAMLDTTIRSGWAEIFWRGDPLLPGAPNLRTMLNSFGYQGPIHNSESGVPTLPPGGADCVDCQPEIEQRNWFRLALPMWGQQSQAGFFADYSGQDGLISGGVLLGTSSTTTREAHFGVFYSINYAPGPSGAKPLVAEMQATPSAPVTPTAGPQKLTTRAAPVGPVSAAQTLTTRAAPVGPVFALVVVPPPGPPPAPTLQVRTERAAWLFALCDLNGNAISSLTPIAKDIKIRVRRNRPSSISARVPSNADAVARLWDDGFPCLSKMRRTLKGYRNENGRSMIRLNQIVWQTQDEGDEDNAWTSFTAFSPMQRLNRRLVYSADGHSELVMFGDPKGPNPTDRSMHDAIAIAKALVDRSRQFKGEHGISTAPELGARFDVSATNRDGLRYERKKIAEALVELTGAFNGFDLDFRPVDRTDGILEVMSAYLELGEFRPDAKLVYAAAGSNCRRITRVEDGDQLVNDLTGVGASQNAGAAPVVSGVAAGSQAFYGVYEDVDSFPDIYVPQLVGDLVSDELAFRANGKETVGWIPMPTPDGSGLLPWDDFYLGDTVPVVAGPRLRGGFQGVQRIDGWDLSVDVEGRELVDVIYTRADT